EHGFVVDDDGERPYEHFHDARFRIGQRLEHSEPGPSALSRDEDVDVARSGTQTRAGCSAPQRLFTRVLADEAFCPAMHHRVECAVDAEVYGAIDQHLV